MDKWSVPTVYAGTRFRSVLEARYARAFDAHSIAWRYEPHCTLPRRGPAYVPDFSLLRSRQLFEVKGVFEPADCDKIQAFLASARPRRFTSEDCPDIALVAGMAGGKFFGWVRGDYRALSPFQFLTTAPREVVFQRCRSCREWWALDPHQGWKCGACGFCDGRRTFDDRIESPFGGFAT